MKFLAIHRIVAAVASLLLCLVFTSQALAQQQGYEPVADKDISTIAANPFIAGAYGFIWVAVLIYVVMLARGLARTQAEVKALQQKLEAQSRR